MSSSRPVPIAALTMSGKSTTSDRLLHDAGDAGLEGVPPDGQDDVRDDQAERVAAAHRVPAGHPVGADPALQSGDPGHQTTSATA